MSPTLLLLLALGLGLAAWLAARARAWSFRRSEPGVRLAALPSYHGWYVALWVLVPAGLFALVWNALAPQLVLQSVLADPAASALPPFGMQRAAMLSEARAVAVGAAPGVFNPAAGALVEPFREAIRRYELFGLAVVLVTAFLGGAWAFLRVKPDLAARTKVERAVMAALVIASLVAILTTLGIFVSLVFETARFFGMVSPADFLFGTHWAPDPMARPEAADPTRYGALPLFWGTIYIGAIIAMIVAIPLGLMSAIYLTQYASPAWRRWLKPALEILAGVPTVVYGYCCAHRRAARARCRTLARGGQRLERERARRRAGDGGDDHPVRLLDGRRFDRRGPAIDARRQPGDGRDHQRDDPPRARARRVTGHRCGSNARGQPCDRRDDDRGHGRGRGGEP